MIKAKKRPCWSAGSWDMTVSFLAQIAPEGGKWKFAVVEHENETRDLFVRITSYFAKLIYNIKVTIFWTKKIENRLLTATVTSFSAFIWSNPEWSDLLKSKLDINNLDPRQFSFRWSLLPMALQSIKKPKKIWEVRFLTATVTSFEAQKWPNWWWNALPQLYPEFLPEKLIVAHSRLGFK